VGVRLGRGVKVAVEVIVSVCEGVMGCVGETVEDGLAMITIDSVSEEMVVLIVCAGWGEQAANNIKNVKIQTRNAGPRLYFFNGNKCAEKAFIGV
jgi:hypothetical protein